MTRKLIVSDAAKSSPNVLFTSLDVCALSPLLFVIPCFKSRSGWCFKSSEVSALLHPKKIGKGLPYCWGNLEKQSFLFITSCKYRKKIWTSRAAHKSRFRIFQLNLLENLWKCYSTSDKKKDLRSLTKLSDICLNCFFSGCFVLFFILKIHQRVRSPSTKNQSKNFSCEPFFSSNLFWRPKSIKQIALLISIIIKKQ